VNLTVFGERYEVEITSGETHAGNPDPSLWYPVMMTAPTTHPPEQALLRTCHRNEMHMGLEAWRAERRSK
jgi:hypothetical protein